MFKGLIIVAALLAPATEMQAVQSPCNNFGDCAGTDSCRDRGDGAKFCMGHGQRGDWCVTGGDCQGVLSCRAVGKGLQACL